MLTSQNNCIQVTSKVKIHSNAKGQSINSSLWMYFIHCVTQNYVPSIFYFQQKCNKILFLFTFLIAKESQLANQHIK